MSELVDGVGEVERLERAVAFLRAQGAGDARLVLVLGSGLERFGEHVAARREIAYRDVPGWPAPGVAGHGGRLLLGSVGGVRVACLQGRVHLYEGHAPHTVVRAVRTLRRCGAREFLLTNAAGGIAEELRAGDLMVIDDHLNLTGRSALCGPHEPDLGPRFPDQTRVWDAALADTLLAVDPALSRGVYAGLLGPSYETPAEVRMLATLGASAVGMSTVLEATALHAMGARVAGVSLISNLAAGRSRQALSHDEVLAAGRTAADRLVRLVSGFCERRAGQLADG